MTSRDVMSISSNFTTTKSDVTLLELQNEVLHAYVQQMFIMCFQKAVKIFTSASRDAIMTSHVAIYQPQQKMHLKEGIKTRYYTPMGGMVKVSFWKLW